VSDRAHDGGRRHPGRHGGGPRRTGGVGARAPVGRRALVLAAVGGLALSGCGLGAGPPPKDVSLRISERFGTRTLRALSDPELAGEDTVLRLLERNARVDTAFSGRFVSAIDGRAGGEDPDGRRRDWLYFVDGLLADRGAAEAAVRDGDAVWWDRHDSGLATVAAVVGSFPAPLRGAAPVALSCAPAARRACVVAARRLAAASVRTRRLRWGARADRRTPRVLVGAWRSVARDPVARRLREDPQRSGVLAVVDGRGRLVPLDAVGRAGSAERRWGLVAALRPRGRAVTWLVIGDGERRAAAAADALRPATLEGRFALRLDGNGHRSPLPAAAEG